MVVVGWHECRTGLAGSLQPCHCYHDMSRTKGALHRRHIPITDPAGFAYVVENLIDGAGGVRECARRIGASVPRLYDWRKGRRSGLSREQFARIETEILIQCQESEGDAGHAFWNRSNALFASLGAPADGLGLWPDDPEPMRRHRAANALRQQPPIYLEDAFRDKATGRLIADHIGRGKRPSVDGAAWSTWPVDRRLYVTRAQFETFYREIPTTFGFDGEGDTLALFETERGPRGIVTFHTAPELPPADIPQKRKGRKARVA